MDKKIFLIFFTLTIILDFHLTLQCSSSSPAPQAAGENKAEKTVNNMEVIESTHYLKFLRNFETVSRKHVFDEQFFRYLKCNGSYDRETGRVMHGLCSYCVEIQPTKNNVYWRCMDKCFTTLKTANCLSQYEEVTKEEVKHMDRFVKELSGSDLKN